MVFFKHWLQCLLNVFHKQIHSMINQTLGKLVVAIISVNTHLTKHTNLFVTCKVNLRLHINIIFFFIIPSCIYIHAL